MDPRPDWDVDDPVRTEQRLRETASLASGLAREVLHTQLARALGAQQRFDEAHQVLDEVDPGDPEVDVRVALERGRLVRSAGDANAARPLFEHAAGLASETGYEDLAVDALHMVARVADPDERLAALEAALTAARSAHDPHARDRDAAILHDLGMVRADAGDLGTALVAFEEALQARERMGDHLRARDTRWAVAWCLRLLGRHEEALALQRALRAELEAVGASDPRVEAELELLQQVAPRP